MMRTVSLLSLIIFGCFASAQGQTQTNPPAGTVIPRVCVENTYQTGTVTLAADAAAGATTISVNGAVPYLVSLIINPGGATEERVTYVNVRIDGSNPYTLSMHDSFLNAINRSSFGNSFGNARRLDYAHSAGETIRFEGYSGLAHLGYNNTSNSTVVIPKGFVGGNFFVPGQSSYPQQITTFLPGIHDNVFSIPFGGRVNDTASWTLNGTVVVFGNTGQGCETITYQGRLTDANAPANGQYDLRFTVFNALTEGAAQSESLVVENAQVTNSVFTVNLNFASTFYNNPNAKFLEIGVRPGAAAGNDPFTVLTPRQTLTSVPFAVNAQYAFNAANAANATQLNGVSADQYLIASTANTNLIRNTTSPQNANINITGTITSGCRTGFTAIGGGRLCVSPMQPAATFRDAMQTCTNMSARIGNSADVMLTFSQSGFNYFLTDNPINSNDPKGWLADIVGDNVRATWNVNAPDTDFDGAPRNIYNGSNGSAPTLLYRCVY